MKIAGVSLIAVANPTPAPASRHFRGVATSRSPTTSSARTALIRPNVIVSRIGSSQLTSGSATASAHHRGQPCRSATGASSQYVASARATTLTAVNTAAAASNGSSASGRSSSAAKGGYVKPRDPCTLSGREYEYRSCPDPHQR